MKYLLNMIFFLTVLSSCEDLLFEEVPTNDPEGNFESLWTTFQERYAVFEARNVDWQELFEQFRPQVNINTSDDELFQIITEMLSYLDDAHVSLMAENKPFWRGHQEFREQTHNLLFDFGVVWENYLTQPVNVNNQYFYGTVANDFGYLWINHLGGDEPGFIDEMIASMSNKKGMIIDLRHNTGGDFTNGEAIVSRFAGQRSLAFSGQPKNGPGPADFGPATDYFIEAQGPAQFSKPVIVLTDRYTLSAGESTLLFLRVLPNVTVIGEPTAGAMGERIEKEMPNGWVYSITGQLITAADGNVYEGPGIPPDIQASNTFEGLADGKDEVLELAIDYLKE